MSQLSRKMARAAATPYRIAVYAHLIREDHFSIFEVQFETHDEQWRMLPPGEERECTRSDFVRISEIQTVTCIPIDEDTVTQNAVKSLDTTAQNIRNNMYQQLDELANRKKQLLAITYQPEVEHPGEIIIQAGEGGNAGGEVIFDPPPSYSGDSQGSVFDIPPTPVAKPDFDDDIPF